MCAQICQIEQYPQGSIKFTFQEEECLLVSFFFLTEYLNVMCLRYAMESKGPTLWSPHELNINVLLHSVQHKRTKLVELRSLTSHLIIRRKVNIYQLTFIVRAVSSECVIYQNMYQKLQIHSDWWGAACLFFSFFFCIVTLALVCFFFKLRVRRKSLL